MRTALRALAVVALLAGACPDAGAESSSPTVAKRNFVFSAGQESPELEQIATAGSGGKVFAGVLFVILRGKDDDQVAKLGAGDYEPVLLRESGEKEKYRRYYQLFLRDPAKMTPSEREETVQRYRAVLDSRRAAAENTTETGPDPLLALTAFLHPGRAETDEGEYGFGELEKVPKGAVTSRVVTLKGTPAANQLVYLYNYNPVARKVQPVATDRSDADGSVSFSNLPTNRYYRIESAPSAPDLAFGPPILLVSEKTETFPAITLAPKRRLISGIVSWEGNPASRVRVVSVGGGQPELSTTTDANGYFQLSPLREGSVRLVLSRPDIALGAGHVWSGPVGSNEVVLPMELLNSSPATR